MTPTTRDLEALAAHHRMIGELLGHPQVQASLIAHYHDLHGHGLKAAVSDADGSRASTPTSAPENAVTAPPDASQRKAANIRTALGNAKHANHMLSSIIKEATEERESVATKCRVCSNGMIPVGRVRCDNEKCFSHGDTTITCSVEGCTQRLITGTTGKTKPHTIPTHHEPVCLKHWQNHRRTTQYDRTLANRGTTAIDIHNTDGITQTKDDAA